MTKQKKHIRVSKNGKTFKAGSKKPLVKMIVKREPNDLFIINDAQKFQRIIAGIKEYLAETVFTLNPGSMTLIAMDPANVAMVNVIFKPELVQVFDKASVAVNTANLSQILKNKKGVVRGRLVNNKLQLVTESNITSIPLIDFESKEQKVPDLKFVYFIKVGLKDFINALKEMDVVGESVTLKGFPNNLILLSSGDLNETESTIKGISTGEETQSKFSLEYLMKLSSLSSIYPDLRVMLGKNYVGGFEFDDSDAKFYFLLAPRVDNDNDETPPTTPPPPAPPPSDEKPIDEKKEVVA